MILINPTRRASWSSCAMPIRPADLDRIRALPLFMGASPAVFRDATAGAFLQRFPAGTTLLMEGDPVDFLYVLLSGSVELQGSWKEKESTLAVLRPVSTFILAAVMLEAQALMSARTLEPSQILMLSGEALRRTARQDADFGFAVIQELAGCYRGVVRTVKAQKLRGGVERLANYLLAQCARQQNEARIILPHEKRVLASLLGMTPENLSRAFAQLSDYGVHVRGAQISFERPRALKRLARPSALIDNHAPAALHPAGKAASETWSTDTEEEGGGAQPPKAARFGVSPKFP
ncbi:MULTISPECIES: transcriptional activator FtrB [Brevundimonas]|uniref:transcriptional activator FtrB n=1 Tax=Brevundimonas sp. 357 TaxID=2555782 RepID=UPI001FB2695C|nr:cyclic nucleotide-binding domain-containing protein [Brevundimonas sp. 357]